MASDGTRNRDLIERCRQGDRKAEHELFHLYKETVARLVIRFLGSADKGEVQDTIQQAYISLFRSISLFRGEASFDTWVYRICMKVCTDTIRRKYRKRTIELDSGGSESLERIGDSVARSDELAERREMARDIRQALDNLDPDRRAVLVLFEMEGRSLEEIAQATESPVGTVKSRLFRARKEMCQALRRWVSG